MRMWMVDVSMMCNRHLIAEHCENHMFVGALNKHKNLKGYVVKNCLEYKSLQKRHNTLAIEMMKRGFNHNSPLPLLDNWNFVHNRNVYFLKVDVVKSIKDLLKRCSKCKRIYNKINRKQKTGGKIK